MTTNGNHVDEAELSRLGIERVTTDIFVWGRFRYTNARDAVAAALRGRKK